HVGSAKVVDVSTDMVAVFDSQQISVFKATDGTLLLREPVCRNSYLAHIYDAKLYFPCSGMTAVSIDSGETVWETKENSASTAAAYSDGVLYSNLSVDVITALDLEKQQQIWSVPLPSGYISEIKVADEFLLVSDGNLCVLQRQDGKKLWCKDSVITQQNPAKLGDAVYILNSTQNMIAAFDIHNGTELGQLRMSKFKPITTFGQLMVSSDELLIFAIGKEVFAFGK
ncbi:MAG TPA: PQQ-binding-like beta-propeller repeat protein, partial [Anaerolineales bacterium]|nr:PQQ-binding-like beta-propeller repeat protein [Anaerolineales bacterium]